jgi:hypothetical protein
MLSSLPLVQQAAIGDCLSFDPFPFDKKGLGTTWHYLAIAECAKTLALQ